MNDDRLDVARHHLGLTHLELWIDYFALGGLLDLGEMTMGLFDSRQLSDINHDVLVHALNEHFQDRGEDHPLPYRAAA